ncbi:MAG: PA14 domain-containing protein, partial [Opitutales bacterium]
FGKIDHEIEIETLRGQMRYDLERFTVGSGAKVKLVLRNNDDMPHNLVLCKPIAGDVRMEVSKKAWALGGDALAKHYVPEHPAILFHTTLVPPRSAQSFYFKAPSRTGSYPYVCTLPGHAFYMKGTMSVANLLKTASGKPVGLSEMTFKVYQGEWDRLPDFDKLEPKAKGKLGNALITPKVAKLDSHFGILFEGVLAVPNKGRYSFELVSADGSRLEVKGQSVIDNDGAHGHQARTGGINLDPGDYPFRLLYFKRGSNQSLTLRWRGPGVTTAWLTKPPSGKSGPAMPILPQIDGEAVMYRNFIAGAGVRGIAVGYPQGVNIAFDANQLRLALLWQGAFMDGGRHWSGRGQGFQGPAGYAKISLPESPPFALLDNPGDTWPKPENGRSQGYRFLGYDRDKARRPAFLYEFSGVKVRDFPKGAVALTPYLIREFTLEGRTEGQKLHYLAAAGQKITMEDEAYVVDAKYTVSFPNHKGPKPVLRDSGGRKELLLPLELNGKKFFAQRYGWHYE